MKINLLIAIIASIIGCSSLEKNNISNANCSGMYSLNLRLVFENLQGIPKFSLFLISEDDELIDYLYKYEDFKIDLCILEKHEVLKLVLYIEDTNKFKKNKRFSTYNEETNHSIVSFTQTGMLSKFTTSLKINKPIEANCFEANVGEEFEKDFEYYLDHIFIFNYLGGRYPYKIYKIYLNPQKCDSNIESLKGNSWEQMNKVTGELKIL